MFFNKPKAKYNIVNDIDSEVYNLFTVLQTNKHQLYEAIEQTPYHDDVWEYWKTTTEQDPVRRAVRFLGLSNYGYLGMPDTLLFGMSNIKQNILNNIEPTFKRIADVQFMNCDFREVFKRISFKDEKAKHQTFVYADPPYLGTANNYQCGFTEQDSHDLFEALLQSGLPFAMSEFDHPFIIKQATDRKLHIIDLCIRQNLKNRRKEILITNYKPNTLF